MKISARAAWTYCGTLVLALIALCLLPEASGSLEPWAEVSQAAELELREEYPRNRFEPKPEGSLVTLRYWFRDKDNGGLEREVSCQVDERSSAELKRGVGLELCPDGGSLASTNQPLSACVRGSEIEWRGQPPALASPRWQKDHPYAHYMLERGLRCHRGQLVLDYPTLIVKAAPLFQDCILNLKGRLSGELGTEEDLRLLMKFFLAMNTAEVPEADQKKWTGGYLLPVEVLRHNTGDCDSKAATFCSVVRDSRSLVIFRSDHLIDNSEPGHAFVGLDVTSSDFPLRNEGLWTEGPIQAGHYDRFQPLEFWGRSYVPIDVTGPGDTQLGEVVREKVGDYVAIPIPSSNTIRPATDESCLVDQEATRRQSSSE